MKSQKNLAIIGIGRWGKNLLREFSKVTTVRYVYHQGNTENSKWLQKNYPGIKVAGSYNEILKSPEIDAVIIAAPIVAHYELAKKALLAGKHVFVEKPITDSVKHAQELVKLAAKKKRILFVGHIFSYHPVLAKIKSIASHEPIKYASFVWNKLGTFNEELVFNLVSHDIATALELFGSSSTTLPSGKVVLGKPTSIKTLENRGMVTDSDIIYIRLGFPPKADHPLAGKNRRSCTIYINRISNLKNKTVTLVTNKNIYLWETDKLFRFDKKFYTYRLIFESRRTPLEVECGEFIKRLQQRKKPLTSGEFGLEVVKILSKI